MGKLNSVATATGNTIATPIRRGGELANALGNIPRQGYSSVKNLKEVQIQTWNTLMDNFLNFSKVKGKWYQKMLKVPANLISACTRRPAVIAGASVASSLNQSVRQPFKKLLLDTPVKLFKGVRNATRIFSTKKGFDFQSYDTHETTGDTWINKIKEKSFGFFTGKDSAKKKDNSVAETKSEAKKPDTKAEIKKPEEKKEETKKIETKKEEIKKEEKKSDSSSTKTASTPSGEKPTSIDEHQQQEKAVTKQKEAQENSKNFPKWETLADKFKAEYKKEYDKVLKGKPTAEGIIARGKEAKMGDNPEEIVKNLKEKEPTFAGYIEEILKKESKSAKE